MSRPRLSGFIIAAMLAAGLLVAAAVFADSMSKHPVGPLAYAVPAVAGVVGSIPFSLVA